MQYAKFTFPLVGQAFKVKNPFGVVAAALELAMMISVGATPAAATVTLVPQVSVVMAAVVIVAVPLATVCD